MTRPALAALIYLALVCGEVAADVNGGIAAYKRGDYATAVSEFSLAASKDDVFAQNALGTMYAQGRGVEQNYKLAMDWFFRAQVLGSPEATANLAKMYANGLGVAQNNTAALQYYRDAAQAGFHPAIMRLAEIYEKGELGVAADTMVAQEWRSRLPGVRAEGAKLPAPAAPAESAAATGNPPTASLPTAAGADQTVGRLGETVKVAQFGRQVSHRLESNSLRERKMFVASTDNIPALAEYLKELRTRLSRLLVSNFSTSRPDERIIVSLNIQRDGTLSEVELSQGSGSQKTDRRALSSLNKLKRLAPLPAETASSADVLVVSVRLPIE